MTKVDWVVQGSRSPSLEEVLAEAACGYSVVEIATVGGNFVISFPRYWKLLERKYYLTHFSVPRNIFTKKGLSIKTAELKVKKYWLSRYYLSSRPQKNIPNLFGNGVHLHKDYSVAAEGQVLWWVSGTAEKNLVMVRTFERLNSPAGESDMT